MKLYCFYKDRFTKCCAVMAEISVRPITDVHQTGQLRITNLLIYTQPKEESQITNLRRFQLSVASLSPLNHLPLSFIFSLKVELKL